MWCGHMTSCSQNAEKFLFEYLRENGRQTERMADRQREWQTDRENGRQTDRLITRMDTKIFDLVCSTDALLQCTHTNDIRNNGYIG